MSTWAGVMKGTGRVMAWAVSFAAGAALAGGVAQAVPNFRLLDHQGHSFELHRLKERKAVVLMVTGTGCPIVRHSLPALKDLRSSFGTNGVEFALFDPNTGDTTAAIADEAREFAIDFPILMDRDQLVARQLGVARTAEVYVIDPRDWTVAYHGPLDDRLDYGQQKPEANAQPVAAALKALVAGEKPVPVSSPAKGCVVVYDGPFAKGADDVDYARDVAPIMAEHCAGCHQAGGGAPFAFDGYARVRSKSGTMLEALLEKIESGR